MLVQFTLWHDCFVHSRYFINHVDANLEELIGRGCIIFVGGLSSLCLTDDRLSYTPLNECLKLKLALLVMLM